MNKNVFLFGAIIVLALVLTVTLTDPSENTLKITGHAIDDNVTDNSTIINETTTDTNETTEINITTEDNSTITNETTTDTNETTETNETNETCVEDWSCENWGSCSGSSESRSCEDANSCGTEIDKPSTSQSCVMPQEPSETEEKEETSGEVVLDLEAEKAKALAEAEAEAARIKALEESQQIIVQSSSEDENTDTTNFLGTGAAIALFEETNCTGCLLDEKCYDFNKRKKDQYCLETGLWQNQSDINATCVENYECGSNRCEEDQCVEYSFVKALVEWLKKLFVFERNLNETNATNFSEEI